MHKSKTEACLEAVDMKYAPVRAIPVPPRLAAFVKTEMARQHRWIADDIRRVRSIMVIFHSGGKIGDTAVCHNVLFEQAV